MSTAVEVLKRLVIGRARRSEELGETLLPKRIALPICAFDPLTDAPSRALFPLSLVSLIMALRCLALGALCRIMVPLLFRPP